MVDCCQTLKFAAKHFLMKKTEFILLVFLLSVVSARTQDISGIVPDTIPQGSFTMAYGNMTISGHFKDSLMTGNWVTYFPTGQVHIVEHFRQGKRDGIYFKISRRGSIEEQAEYSMGELNSQKVDFNPGGKARLIEYYDHGKLEGLRTVFYKKGTVQEESYYHDGEKDSTSKWFDTKGNKIAEYNYSKGYFDGWQRTWYANDVLKNEQFYKDNIPVGDYKAYFRNGQLQESGIYKNSLKDGEWNKFDETGKLIRETRFKKGKLIDEKNY